MTGPAVTIVNSTPDRAEEVAGSTGGLALGLDSLTGALAEADSVIVTTSAPVPILDLETVSAALSARVGRRLAPLVIVDMSCSAKCRPLRRRSRRGRASRHRRVAGARRSRTRRSAGRAERAESIVERRGRAIQSRRSFQGRCSSSGAARGKLEELRRQELERMRGRAKDLTEEQWQQVEEVTRSVLAKLLHRADRRTERDLGDTTRGAAGRGGSRSLRPLTVGC